MRVAADQSQDPYMMSIFWNDQDIHTMTARRMFQKLEPEPIDDKKERYPAKRTGFGVLYGISPAGLVDVFYHDGVTTFSEGDCARFIDDWFNTFPGVVEWINRTKAEARRTGMVRDMFGRIRYTPEVYSALEYVRDAGLRQAVNAPIQSGAQGIIKEAMKQLMVPYRAWQEAGYYVKVLMQIHDELIFEVEDGILPYVIPQFKQFMVEAVKLSVPVKVDAEVGKNWAELVKWEG
jgi:DNA polymerase-1